MIKKNKQLEKRVDQFMKDTFSKNGEIDSQKVKVYVKSLKALPIPDSILALALYLRRIKTESEKTTLEIETAIPLSLSQMGQIAQALKAEHEIRSVKSKINPSLLGGLRVKIGDVVYDDSVSRRILQLGESIQG